MESVMFIGMSSKAQSGKRQAGNGLSPLTASPVLTAHFE